MKGSSSARLTSTRSVTCALDMGGGGLVPRGRGTGAPARGVRRCGPGCGGLGCPIFLWNFV